MECGRVSKDITTQNNSKTSYEQAKNDSAPSSTSAMDAIILVDEEDKSFTGIPLQRKPSAS